MEIIYKTDKKLENAKAFLFGLKNLSTLENQISLEELKDFFYEDIFISIDKNIFNEELPFLEDTLKQIDNYNIKGILFYDLSVLSLAKKLKIKTPLIWNQDFLVTNYKTCEYYKKDGVKGAVASSVITIDELVEICKNTDLKIFVYGFGYQSMATSRRKLISNYFEYINEKNDKKINYMIEKESKYPVKESDYGTKIYTKDVLNVIKHINKLKKANISYIILDNFLIEDKTFEIIRELYEKAVNEDLSDEKLCEMEEKINKIIPNSGTLFYDKKTIYKVKKQ